jgi:4-hydroxy-tetrahydrodipicolinate reductase
MPLQLAIHGAGGRMGRRVVALASGDPRFHIAAAVDQPQHPELGQDAGLLAGVAPVGAPLASSWQSPLDVVIDFSLPEAFEPMLEQCLGERVPLVIATTGLSGSQQEQIHRVGETIPIVWAPSMSLSVNLAMKLSQQAAAALREAPGGLDLEVIERHHRFKEDAPSGTALKFGELLAETLDGPATERHGRHGKTGRRGRNEIGYHAVRAGDNPGQHTIVFGMLGETLEIKVAASSRDCYAAGALSAAAWLADRPAGVYSMFDVLELG